MRSEFSISLWPSRLLIPVTSLQSRMERAVPIGIPAKGRRIRGIRVEMMMRQVYESMIADDDTHGKIKEEKKKKYRREEKENGSKRRAR